LFTRKREKIMRRRLLIKKRLQRSRLNARRLFAKTGRGANEMDTYNFCLISAGLTDRFPG
jgi:hypothetical protein